MDTNTLVAPAAARTPKEIKDRRKRLRTETEVQVVENLPTDVALAQMSQERRSVLITSDVIHLLEQALEWGWSVVSACDFAGISEDTYQALIEDPQYRIRLEVMRSKVMDLSRKNVFEAVEGGDLPTSKWVLERRTPEYSPRQRVDMTVEAEMDDAALLRSLERLAAASRERSALAEPDEELSQDAQAMLE